jgi:hypothetical protein
MSEDGKRRGVTQRIRHGGTGWELRETSRASAGYSPPRSCGTRSSSVPMRVVSRRS